ncbi:2-oxoglutarate and iron-dependent oxygenase JMJD4 homolog [Drosophila elegans]|uniref:2-oxoglutarate and iron-dependent oxygenase JMJD4 homolog n=1 Tax=Drosophila elegans TaxID=30023 RepID=UPI0007E7F13F|nr:2-oxoglutarate and iron-dependent oxygenase JMJD4 homolog [Drosophila elegans]
MASEALDGDNLLQLQPEENGKNDGQLLPDEIQRCTGLSYNDFYWRYMHKNFPVIITDVSNDWECQQWTVVQEARDLNSNRPSASSSINFDYLKNKITNCPVPVADCNSSYFNSHTKLELNFHDYLERWRSSIGNQSSSSSPEVNSNVDPATRDNLYLKDWHLAAQMPEYKFYKVPKYFASDWLNEQLMDQKKDDYRFVYMGPKNSWTSYHSDVFGSFSWSTNIVGLKKWIIMPPGEELKLNDRLGNPPFSIDEQMLDEHNVRYYTIDQRANEAVFVPSGWFHQVWNLTDTISVNHNWFNACNISMVWQNLRHNLKAVCREISDCQQMDDFEAHCQTMLRASFGINYLDFIELLEFIAARRLAEETAATKFLLFDSYRMNDYHVQYDLECLRRITRTLSEDPTIQRSPLQLEGRCRQLLARLEF